jgi:hypothetical protein
VVVTVGFTETLPFLASPVGMVVLVHLFMYVLPQVTVTGAPLTTVFGVAVIHAVGVTSGVVVPVPTVTVTDLVTTPPVPVQRSE